MSIVGKRSPISASAELLVCLIICHDVAYSKSRDI